MNEDKLLKISFIFSIIGILIIMFYAEKSQISVSNISEITKDRIDEKVRIQGSILSITKAKDVTLIHVKDQTGEILVVVFYDLGSLDRSSKVEIYGTITEYRNEMEIIADQINTI